MKSPRDCGRLDSRVRFDCFRLLVAVRDYCISAVHIYMADTTHKGLLVLSCSRVMAVNEGKDSE